MWIKEILCSGTFVTFTDFKQAYDRNKSAVLFKALRELGANGKLANKMQLMLKVTQNVVKINGECQRNLSIRNG